MGDNSHEPLFHVGLSSDRGHALGAQIVHRLEFDLCTDTLEVGDEFPHPTVQVDHRGE